MYREYPLTLPGGFVLPGAHGSGLLQSLRTFGTRPSGRVGLYPDAALCQDLSSGAMTAGTVLDASETFAPEEGAYVLSGSYSCLESIGRSRREETGETNEQGS